MITLFLSGGLGNQLFNYAAARSLADRVRTELLIDVVEYRSQWGADAQRPLLLHRFPLRAKFRNFGPKAESHWIGYRLARRLREDAFSSRVFREPKQLGYFSEFEKIGSRSILHGHFIDKTFFSHNESNVRSDLTINESSLKDDIYFNNTLSDIRKCNNPVSVHVRRGDLIDYNNRWLLLPDIERYYHASFNIFEKLTKHDVTLYVFSDDVEWCQEAFRSATLPIKYVSRPSNKDPLKDFFLMTQCRHHVIANSAFSWWAAWLSTGVDKQVIAPFRWDLEGIIDIDCLLPNDWMRLKW